MIFYRKFNLPERIAWKRARAYAELTGLRADQSYAQIIIENTSNDAGPNGHPQREPLAGSRTGRVTPPQHGV